MTDITHPRILLVTRNLPPLVGGMERLNWHMAAELAKSADVRIIGPAGSAALAPTSVDVREAPLKPLWKFLLRARSLARREAKQWKPDIVLAGSGLAAPLALRAARACGAKSAVYVHGLDVAVKHPVYRAIWIPSLRRMDRVIANSHATAELCRGIRIDSSRIGIVHPGVDLPDVESKKLDSGFDPTDRPGMTTKNTMAAGADRDAEPQLPTSHSGAGLEGRNPESSFSPSMPAVGASHNAHLDLGQGPLLLSVGRLSSRKGLREFVAQCLPRIVAVHPDTTLLIVGDAPRQALHAEAQTPSNIQSAADAAGVGANIKFLGTITDYAELGAVYRAASVHVFPVREIPGDPEGFGMVAVEAAAHELPTVAFATGGVVDAVAEGQSGHLVPPGNYAAFADAVLHTLDERDNLRESCVDFARQFAWPAFGRQVAAQLRMV